MVPPAEETRDGSRWLCSQGERRAGSGAHQLGGASFTSASFARAQFVRRCAALCDGLDNQELLCGDPGAENISDKRAHVWRGCACRAALGLRRRLDLNDFLASVTLSHTVHSMHTSMSSVCDERLTLLTTTLLSRPGAEPPERSDIVHGDVAEALQPRDAAQQASCVLMFRSPPVGGAVVRSPSPHRVLVASLCVRDDNPHHHGRVLLLPSDPRYSSSLGAPFYARADAHRHHPNLHSDVRRALALSRLLSAL